MMNCKREVTRSKISLQRHPMAKILRLSFVFLCFVLAGIPSWGQNALYATFSGSRPDYANSHWTYGSTFGFYRDSKHIPGFDFGYDIRGTILATDRTTKVIGGQWGPRMNLRLPMVKPYVEGLVGAAHVETGTGASYRSNIYLSYGLVGGANVTLLPRLDWRVVDFTYGGYPALYGHTNYKTVSTGLVLRLP